MERVECIKCVSQPVIIFRHIYIYTQHGGSTQRGSSSPRSQRSGDQVLLRMGSVGICGSDIMYWQRGGNRRFRLEAPMVIGHEGSGTVAKVGSKVKTLKIGDRVAIEPGTPCRQCFQCKQGTYNLCPGITFCATPPDHGNICRYYKHAEDFCFKLPDHVTLDEGALMEPLSVAIYACRRGEVTLGSKLLICGAGPVGILCMMAGKAAGASQVLITDIDDNRLRMAKSLGADHTINVNGRDKLEVAGEIEALMGGQPEVTIECSSVDYSYVLGIHATRPGGCLVVVGRPSQQTVLPLDEAFRKQVDMKGVFRYTNCYPAALAMISTGKINVKPMITHHFTLNETLRAFETAISHDAKAVKVIIHCDQ
ncbi:sorbitol dehydrogenase-like isoform X2 [Haliotis rufescens]|uniref:sorbitol dehydrogenase-like isoform X2 n=1 Tax=Haliotis rufescens TaxID=6454 RepID=UPI00201EC0AF|nr:sorbitol dehydrogenase-like isoform X2 [Haliotis rufescens]